MKLEIFSWTQKGEYKATRVHYKMSYKLPLIHCSNSMTAPLLTKPPHEHTCTDVHTHIVRFSEPVVIVAARAPSSWSSGCFHWPWLSASLVPLSLFLRAWREFFLLFIFLCTCGYDSVRACRGGYFEMFDVLGSHFEYSTVIVIPLLLLFFPLCTGPGTHCHP